MKYFTGCRTIDDVKQMFHKLAKKLHPDAGGSAADFREMMSEYKRAFEQYKNVHMTREGEMYEKETTETPEEFAEIINKVIHMEGVTIEIIGSWVWLTGNTMTYKDQIKAAGFWWSKSKKAWYHNGEKEHKKYRGHYSMDGLREKWGSQEVQTEKQERIA